MPKLKTIIISIALIIAVLLVAVSPYILFGLFLMILAIGIYLTVRNVTDWRAKCK